MPDLEQIKKKLEEKHHHLFDAIIVILVVVIVILADLFVVSLRSAPGEYKGDFLEENKKQQKIDLVEIKADEKVFVPILNFHHIDQAPATASKITQSYYIEPANFEQIIQEIINNNYEPVFVSEIVDYLSQGVLPKNNIIAITFDDGNENFYTNAWPILQKYKVKSSVYIMTGVGGPNYLSKEQVVELDKSGLVEIGSHTVWHPKLTQVPADERLYELEKSRDDLKELLARETEVICYPFGLYNEEIKALAKAVGYKAGLTFDQDAWQDPEDLFELKRLSVYPDLDVIKFLDKLKENK